MKSTKTYECPVCYYARIIAVAVFGVFIAWVLMTEGFNSVCSGYCQSFVSVVFSPATFIAKILGNGSGEIVGTYFSIGMIFQFLALYMIGNSFLAQRKSK